MKKTTLLQIAKRVAFSVNRTSQSCPIPTNYGGLPAGGGFQSYREYLVGASRILEAAHCALGSLGRMFGPEGELLDLSLRSDLAHIKEELGIIVNAAREYSRDIYLKQLDTPDHPYDAEVVADHIMEKAPSLRKKAVARKAEVDAGGPKPIVDTALATYDLVITLADALVESAQQMRQLVAQDKKPSGAVNAFKTLQASGAVDRLSRAVSHLEQFVEAHP